MLFVGWMWVTDWFVCLVIVGVFFVDLIVGDRLVLLVVIGWLLINCVCFVCVLFYCDLRLLDDESC